GGGQGGCGGFHGGSVLMAWRVRRALYRRAGEAFKHFTAVLSYNQGKWPHGKTPPGTPSMLRNTFCHLPGIGPRGEQKLWEAGVTSWTELLAQAQSPKFPPRRKATAEHLAESLHHYQQRNPRYFADLLQANQHWRLFDDFRGACAYL